MNKLSLKIISMISKAWMETLHYDVEEGKKMRALIFQHKTGLIKFSLCFHHFQ
jgi:hypothetical protein